MDRLSAIAYPSLREPSFISLNEIYFLLFWAESFEIKINSIFSG